MNKIKMMLWGREFNFDIKYDCFRNEQVLLSQELAVQNLSRMSKELETSLRKVKEYCLSNNRKEIGSDVIDNIFRFVAPKYLFIPREGKKQIVAIMCNYKYDPESGIAVVFENGKFKDIGKQEIIL